MKHIDSLQCRFCWCFFNTGSLKKSIFAIALTLKVVPTPARQAERRGQHVTKYWFDLIQLVAWAQPWHVTHIPLLGYFQDVLLGLNIVYDNKP